MGNLVQKRQGSTDRLDGFTLGMSGKTGRNSELTVEMSEYLQLLRILKLFCISDIFVITMKSEGYAEIGLHMDSFQFAKKTF